MNVEAIPVFDGTNFQSWKFRMKLYLEMKEVSSATEAEPGEDAAKKKTDIKALSYIANGLANSQLNLVMDQTSAYGMWKKLNDVYSRKNKSLQILAEQVLAALKYEPSKESRSEFVSKFDAAVTKVRSVGKTLDEDSILSHFMLKLPADLSHLIDLVDVLPAGQSKIGYVCAKFLSKCNDLSEKVTSSVEKHTGSSSQVKSEPMESDHSVFKMQRDNVTCYNCGGKGYISKYCRNKGKNDKRRGGFKNRGGSQHRRGGYQRRGGQNYNHRGGQNYNRQGGYQNEGQNDRGSSSSQRQAESFLLEIDDGAMVNNVAVEVNGDKNMMWLMDSGCTDHVVCRKEYFSEYIKLKRPTSIRMGDEYPHTVEYIGSVNVIFKYGSKFTPCKVKNVYLVEAVKKIFLSITTLDKAGYHVINGNSRARIVNPSGDSIAEGFLKGKLYELTCSLESDYSDVDGVLKCNHSNVVLDKKYWHMVLGHVNFSDLRYLCKDHMVDGLTQHMSSEFVECDICQRNKMRNLCYGDGRSRAKGILNIVHTNVNGPHKTSGYKGEEYFVTFIDDFSKFVAIYTIKNKSEVFGYFVQYYNFMCNLTNRKIKFLRCDNGREYTTNSRFYEFAAEKGFVIKNVPTYSQALNGVAERYN